MSLDKIIGHEMIKKQFKNSILSGRFPHASIIVGEDGIGKSIIAEELANLLINKKTESQSVDIIKIKPINKKSLGIDDIRFVIEEANKKPVESKNKVIIIYKSEIITEVAQNAFLKTIEDPPKGVYIILLCENMQNILDTIKSRCEVFKLNRLSVIDMSNFIQNKYNLSKEKVDSTVIFSDGIPGKAEKFIEDENLPKIRDWIFNLILESSRLDKYSYINKYEKLLLKAKENYEEIFTWILTYLRDVLVYKETGSENLLLNVDKIDEIKHLSEKFSYKKLDQMINILNDSQDKLNKNVNGRLVFDEILTEIQEV